MRERPIAAYDALPLASKLEAILTEASAARSQDEYTAAGEKAIRLLPQIVQALAASAGTVSDEDDGMCNADNPGNRCICREEFGHKVCGGTVSDEDVDAALNAAFDVEDSDDSYGFRSLLKRSIRAALEADRKRRAAQQVIGDPVAWMHPKSLDRLMKAQGNGDEDASGYAYAYAFPGSKEDVSLFTAHLATRAAPPAAQAVPDLPLDDDVREILGRPNFKCIRFAQCLRTMGHDIANKAEAEQAATIHWLLGHYFRHGPGWRKAAMAELELGLESAAATPTGDVLATKEPRA